MVTYAFAWLFLSLLLNSCTPPEPLAEQLVEPLAQTSNHDPDDAKAVALTGQGSHLCAHLASKRVKCWGDNSHGQCNLKAARNASGKELDASNARFSKITTGGGFFTCGILQEANYDGIPVCFGRGDAFSDLPNEKFKDIVAGPNFVCFVKHDDTIGCVGTKTQIMPKALASTMIDAKDLPKHGIDAHREDLDFSHKFLTNFRAKGGRLCGQGADGIVYCMGTNIRGAGETIAERAIDFRLTGEGTLFITAAGLLKSCGDGYGFNLLSNITNPKALKYKKFVNANALLTAAGNVYDDGTPIPENTLIPYGGEVEEDVLDAVEVESSMVIGRIRCVIKGNHKIACRPIVKSQEDHPEAKTTPVLKDLPKELLY